MDNSPELNPGLGPNEVVSPDNLHTEPPFVRPVYEEPVEEQPEDEKPKRGRPKK